MIPGVRGGFWGACLVALVGGGSSLAGDAPGGKMFEEFQQPGPAYQPQVWLHWINGHIGKAGLTKDLEAMREAGIGGGIVFDLLQPGPRGSVGFFDAEWRGLKRHLFQEAGRLDLEFGIHNCPGYSSSGGPWVPVGESMKKLGWTETIVDGPCRLADPLPRIPENLGFYRDVAVLAYPEVPGGGNAMIRHRNSAKVVAGGREVAVDALTDQDPGSALDLQGVTEVDVVFPVDVSAASVGVGLQGVGREPAIVEVFAKNAGGEFVRLAGLDFPAFSTRVQTANFSPVRAREFRLVMREGGEKQAVGLGEVGVFSSPMVSDPTVKAHFAAGIHGARETVIPDGSPDLPAASGVLDLTDRLRPGGTLDWEAPAGTWTILRFGMTTNGKGPHPTRVRGLECDKLDPVAVRNHLQNYAGVLVADAGEHAGKAFRSALIDSYEVGMQNWTERMPVIFQERSGYPIGPWMVALTGRLVEGARETERFLWDFRNTVAGQFADAYYGTFDEFLNQHGMVSYAEAYEGHGRLPGNASQCLGRVEVPMCEFWWREPRDGKFPGGGGGIDYVAGAHAANTTGKPIVAAEAFSTLPPEAGWRNHPAAMKAQADQAFLTGVNQIQFHSHPHQPYDAAPGLTLGVWGSQFGRLNSWWPLSRGWHDYLARCQRILREGTTRSDVARLIDTEVPERYGAQLPPPGTPPGYRWDNIGAEVVLQDLRVRDGKWVLDHGAEYVLLITENTQMPIEMLRKLAGSVRAGAVLYGPRPVRTTGLRNHQANEAELARITEELWGPIDGKTVTENAVGRGRVVWGQPLADLLPKLLPPDFSSTSNALGFLHRTAPGFDAWFVVNRSHEPVTARCKFRVSGRPAELWDPVTGSRQGAGSASESGGLTALDLSLPPQGSVFVVFREGAEQLPLRPLGESAATIDVPGPWEVCFQAGRGGPDEPVTFDRLASWHESEDARIRYFSGMGTYRTTLALPELPKGGEVILDLGAVADVARVRVNGQSAGDAWQNPPRIAIGRHLKAGENTLEIEVANRWINRLIGDEYFPEDVEWKPSRDHGATGSAVAVLPEWFPDLQNRPVSQRVGFPFYKHYTKDSPLVPSGLLGPVKIVCHDPPNSR